MHSSHEHRSMHMVPSWLDLVRAFRPHTQARIVEKYSRELPFPKGTKYTTRTVEYIHCPPLSQLHCKLQRATVTSSQLFTVLIHSLLVHPTRSYKHSNYFSRNHLPFRWLFIPSAPQTNNQQQRKSSSAGRNSFTFWSRFPFTPY